jgi:large subunit ribosomal protein L13
MKTTKMVNDQQVVHQWHLIDADGQVVGRLASQVATLLRGKHKPTYTPHTDTGDHVVLVNAAKVRFTGRKLTQKVYYRHSGYPGGLKEITARHLLEKSPERLMELAVRGMLPKTPLGNAMLKKLHVYAGPEHPHQAQTPIAKTLRWKATA